MVNIRLSWLAALILGIAAASLYLFAAMARDLGQFADSSPERREWFRRQEIPPLARERLRRDHNVSSPSCCSEGDRFKTRFRVGASGQDVWEYLERDGKWKAVPPDIIAENPSIEDEPILFLRPWDRLPLCFYPGKGGI